MSDIWEKTDHVGVHHIIESVEPVPSGHLHLTSRANGVKIASYHHSMEDAREQVGRNSCFLHGVITRNERCREVDCIGEHGPLTADEFHDLADYNGEFLPGECSDPERVARMGKLQARWNQ